MTELGTAQPQLVLSDIFNGRIKKSKKGRGKMFAIHLKLYEVL